MSLKIAAEPTRPSVPASPDLPAEGPSDLELVRRLRDGDAGAGDALVRRHTPALLGFLRKTVGNLAAAEDLHQATWASAIQHLPNFDPDRLSPDQRQVAFKAWLFRIAANKARDGFRRASRQQRGQEAIAHDPTLSERETASPDADQTTREQAAAVRDAIDRLPPAQREVVVLRYYGQMKFTDVAAVVGCPLNTALGRMHKAAAKLRDMLGETFLE